MQTKKLSKTNVPVGFPFRRKGSKIIIQRAPFGSEPTNKVIQKCDKTGFLLKIGTVVYDDNGEVVGISKKASPGLLEAMSMQNALKKAGVDKAIALKKTLWLASTLSSSHTGKWSAQQAKTQLEEAVKLCSEIRQNKQLRYLLNGITVSQDMTPKEIKNAFRKLEGRIVFAEA